MRHLRKLHANTPRANSAYSDETLDDPCSPSGIASKAVLALPRPLSPRALTDDENLRVRKILACAARMKGRFGKNMLAATSARSAAKNVMQAHLNELSTYGLLKDMRQEDILLYIDALVRCGLFARQRRARIRPFRSLN